MNIPGKELWYDWNGGNEWLFTKINGIRGGKFYDDAMIALSSLADHHHFPYYMAVLAAFALFSFSIQKIRNKGGTPHMLAAWIGALIVLAVGYAVEGGALHFAKDYFSFPRPYMVLSHTTRVLGAHPPNDNYHSFPSGHEMFITLMVVGLWPVLSTGMKWLGAVLIVAVAWSRMALGMHFPMDVLTSFIVFLPATLILRFLIYRILQRAFGIQC